MKSALDTPSGDEIHVWRVDLAESGREAARDALEELLCRYLGTVEAPAQAVDPTGKPRLAEGPERLSFNLSHSGGLAVIAVAAGGVAVGVDVERMKPRRDLVRLAARWMPEADAAAVAGAPDAERERVFYAAWTRYEARVKCTGAGLSGPPPGPEVRAWPVAVDPGYAGAVAVETGAAGLHGGNAPPPIVLRGASCRR